MLSSSSSPTASADSQPKLPKDSGLHLFRRELGGLVLYELSPLAEPQLLTLFIIPPK